MHSKRIEDCWSSVSKCMAAFAFCLLGIGLNAQHPLFRSFTVEDGLPCNEIYTIHKDSRGYMWFGSEQGIARFDGRTFRTYSTADGIGGNLIYDFHSHPEGGFFAFSFNRRVTYIKNDSVKILKNHEVFESMPAAIQIYYPFFYHNGQFHARCHPGTFRLSSDSLILISEKDSAITDLSYNYLCNDGKRTLGITQSDEGLKVRDLNDNKLLYDTSFAERMITDFRYALVGDDSLLMCGKGNVFIWTDDRIQTLPFKSKSQIEVAYRDSKGNFWIGTLGEGLYYSPDLSNWRSMIPNINVTDIEEDNHGGIWVSTLKQGILYNPMPGAELVFEGIYERFSATPDHLGIGLQNGFLIKSRSSSVEEFLPFKSRIFGLRFNPNIHKWLIGGRHLFGTVDTSGALSLFTSGNLSPKHFALNKSAVVAASPSHLIRWTKQNLSDIPRQLKSLPKWFANVEFDGHGQLWAGSSSETYGIDLERNVILDTLPFRMSGLRSLDSGTTLIASFNQGLWIHSLNNQQKKSVNHQVDLPVQRIIDMGPWGDHTAILHEGGLTVLRYKNEEISSNHFPAVSALTHDLDQFQVVGEHCYLGNGKIIVVCPLSEITQEYSVQVEVDYWIENAENKTIRNLQDLTFRDNIFHSRFLYNWFQDKSGFPLRYKLLPDEDWRLIQADEINRDLAPGDYQFQAQYKDPQGVWKNVSSPVVFNIPLPWWKRWQSVVVFVILLVLAVSLVVRYFTARTLNAKNEKERLQLHVRDLQLKALKSQLNPHFIFNSINSLQFFISEERNDEAEEYVRQFSKLLRTVLENSEKETVSLASELELIESMVKMESMKLKGAPISLIFHLNGSDAKNIMIPPFLFQPYIENTIWHGLKFKEGERKLVLEVQEKEGLVHVKIEDNGIGRDQAKKRSPQGKAKKSFGMLIASKRIEALNQDFNRDSNVEIEDLANSEGEALGTRILIKFPKITRIK